MLTDEYKAAAADENLDTEHLNVIELGTRCSVRVQCWSIRPTASKKTKRQDKRKHARTSRTDSQQQQNSWVGMFNEYGLPILHQADWTLKEGGKVIEFFEHLKFLYWPPGVSKWKTWDRGSWNEREATMLHGSQKNLNHPRCLVEKGMFIETGGVTETPKILRICCKTKLELWCILYENKLISKFCSCANSTGVVNPLRYVASTAWMKEAGEHEFRQWEQHSISF